MGFECSFELAKRLKGVTPKRLHQINSYFEYMGNDWALKNYPSWEEYSKQYEEYKDIPEFTQEELEFYRTNRTVTKLTEKPEIISCIDFWCSGGRYFHDWFVERLGGTHNDYIMPQEVSKDVLYDALKYTIHELQNMSFKRVIVNRAFNEDPETETITSIPCNGIEVTDEEGSLKRVYADDWEVSDVYIPSEGYFDEDKYIAFTSLQNTLIKMLDYDLDEYIITYHGGW